MTEPDVLAEAREAIAAKLHHERQLPDLMTSVGYQEGLSFALRSIDAVLARQPEPARGAAPECWTCRGQGWVLGIGADPLPSGEPGEPYQTQETCPDCGGK